METTAARITCSTCGEAFSAAPAPLMRCPACQAVGYADRSRMHMLPLGWTCHTCGHANDGLHNFCGACGAGLLSRCPRCQGPLYSACCQQCGTHAAPLAQIEAAERERRARPAPAVAPLRPSSEAAPSAEPAPTEAAPQHKHHHRRWKRWGWGWGWWWIVFGAFWAVRKVAEESMPHLSATWDQWQASWEGMLVGVASVQPLAYALAALGVFVALLVPGFFLVRHWARALFP